MTLALIEKGFVLEVSWPSKKKSSVEFPGVYIYLYTCAVSSSQLTHFERPNPHKRLHSATSPEARRCTLTSRGGSTPVGSLVNMVGVRDGMPRCNRTLENFNGSQSQNFGGIFGWVFSDDFPPGLKNWVDCLFGEAFVNFPGVLPKKDFRSRSPSESKWFP